MSDEQLPELKLIKRRDLPNGEKEVALIECVGSVCKIVIEGVLDARTTVKECAEKGCSFIAKKPSTPTGYLLCSAAVGALIAVLAVVADVLQLLDWFDVTWTSLRR